MPTEPINHVSRLVPESLAAAHAEIAQQLRLVEPLSMDFLDECFKNTQLFDKKQSDYGPTNIAKFGDLGVIVRMSDKFERLATLQKKKRRRVSDETITDTLRDIANYAIIAIMWREGRWPR